MARTRMTNARIPEDLEQAARARSPELAAVDFSTLVRIGLAVLAGSPLAEAITTSRMRPGPRSRTGQPGDKAAA